MQLERRRQFAWRDQVRVLVPLIVVWAFGTGLIAVIALQDRVSRRALFLDVTAVARVPWYTGLVSDIGILGWTVAAAFAVAGAYISHSAGRPAATRFLAQGAALAAVLCADDLFLLHTNLIPEHTPFHKLDVFAVYALLAMEWIRRNRHEVARTRWQILVAALIAFVASIGFDHANHSRSDKMLILEDGPKLLGILALVLYFALVGRDILRSALLGPRRASPAARTPGVDRA